MESVDFLGWRHLTSGMESLSKQSWFGVFQRAYTTEKLIEIWSSVLVSTSLSGSVLKVWMEIFSFCSHIRHKRS